MISKINQYKELINKKNEIDVKLRKLKEEIFEEFDKQYGNIEYDVEILQNANIKCNPYQLELHVFDIEDIITGKRSIKEYLLENALDIDVDWEYDINRVKEV